MDGFREWLRPELIWFVIGLALLLLELVTPGLVLFFFGMGAWLVALVCFMTDISLNTQLIIFLVSSFLFLILLRRRLKSLFFGRGSRFENIADLMDDYRGKKVRVTRDIPASAAGKIELNGTEWEAVADEAIAAGTIVEIVEKNNITFRVKSI